MSRFRLLRVWLTTLRILLSLAGFEILRRLRGPSWAAEALPRWGQRNARRARTTVTRVQGLFIKIGQLVSMLAGALPAPVRRELEGLQDRIPPRPWEEIEQRLADELGAPPETLFATIDHRPIAAASLAQVHAATLEDGRPVALKVQHRDIERLAAQDLATVRRILALVGFITRARGLPELFDEVQAMIADELDFVREADHAEQIAAQLEADPTVAVPEVVRSLSTRRVLVTAMVDGVKVTDGPGLVARGVEPSALAVRILEAYCQMIFVDGVYHADPHPGNLLVDRQGRLVFVDFGAVGEVSPAMKEGVPRVLEAVVRRDQGATVAAMKRLGFMPRGQESEVAERLIAYVYGRFLDQVDWSTFDLQTVRLDFATKMELNADLKRRDLALHDITGAVEVPREWLLLFRTLILLLGLCTELDPTLRPAAVLRPHVEPLLLGKGRDWMGLAGSLVKDIGLAAVTLPGDVRRLVRRAEAGDLRIEVAGLRESALMLVALGRQLVLALLIVASGGLAYVAHRAGDGGFARGLGWTAGLLTAALALSLWRTRPWLRRLRRGVGRG